MKVVFLCLEDYDFYVEPVAATLRNAGDEVSFVRPEDGVANISLFDGAGLVVTIHSTLTAVEKIVKQLSGRVRTLTLQDGAIEYRSSKHRRSGHFRFRPLWTDYAAVFGERSKNLMVAAGNDPSRIFVTGSPRFDHYASERPVGEPKSAQLLITMSNRPAFSKDSLVNFYRLLAQTISCCEQRGIDFKVRKSRGTRPGGIEHIDLVAERLESNVIETYERVGDSERTLFEDIRDAYAVITTPSTVSMETLAMGRRLCHLIIDAETTYTGSAWTIGRENDIDGILNELSSPPRFKMEYQEMVFRENLAYLGTSTKEVADLIRRLAFGDNKPE